MGDDGLERLQRQVRELEAWISDLSTENRALRERLEIGKATPPQLSPLEARRPAATDAHGIPR